MEYTKITKEMLDGIEFALEDLVALYGQPSDKYDLVSNYVSPTGELFFKVSWGLKPHHFIVPVWGNLKATPKGIELAFALAESAHLNLPAQERAATRPAVWIEGRIVFWSGHWTGQGPEGEVKTSQEMMDSWWQRRDPSFENFSTPEKAFTIGYEPLNDYGHGWYSYTNVVEIFPGYWCAEVIEL